MIEIYQLLVIWLVAVIETSIALYACHTTPRGACCTWRELGLRLIARDPWPVARIPVARIHGRRDRAFTAVARGTLAAAVAAWHARRRE